MTLSEGGESRVRGYLFVLERSLRTFLPPEVTSDALREVESHIRERVSQAEAVPDERAALERVLAELGPPLRVAQAYSVEMTLDEAVATGRAMPIARAVWHMATTSVAGFLWAMVVFTGWALGLSFLIIAALKPVFPGNVGFHYINGRLSGFGMQGIGALPPGVEVHGGYWLIPACVVIGLAVLVVTQRASRRLLSWMRSRRPSARLRVRVEVHDAMTNGKW
jgi:uncharacterized membrane protein